MHQPVLLNEVLAVLEPQPGQTAVDCTVGLAGHAAAIAERLGPTGTLVINDLDPANLSVSLARLSALPSPPRVIPVRGNFAQLPRLLQERALAADLVLADLGFASNQVDDPARGFSFSQDGPLDMRMDPTLPTTAADLVNSLPEHELAQIIRDFGEDRAAARIARKLVAERRSDPITSTGRLAHVVRAAVGPSTGRIDPATRTFQALRIATNDELGTLDALLDALARGTRSLHSGSRTWIGPGARIAIISFHSLEDRRVKQAFETLVREGGAQLLARKPIEAGDEEVARNPRARSAKLRAVRLSG